jgi:hypothetical protein
MRKLDFIILESVIFNRENLSGFCDQLQQPRAEVAIAFYELFLKGYLSARILYEIQWRINSNGRRAYRRHRHLLKRSQNIIEIAIVSLEDIYKSLDNRLTIIYSLTSKGGKYLEQEASINWNLFYEHKNNLFSIPLNWQSSIFRGNKILNAQKKSTNIIYSQKKAIIESWLDCQENNICLESLKWDVLKNQKILYWKQLSEIHIASFLYKSRNRTYPKDLTWYTVPEFESHPPSELLSEYFEYYCSDNLDDLDWKIDYIILKIGILYMEKYKSPRYLLWENYSGDMTQSKTLISATSLFKRGFIEAIILEWNIPYRVSKDVVAKKVFLNKIGIQSALDFQLMAEYCVTQTGYEYCQLLEKIHHNLPKVL